MKVVAIHQPNFFPWRGYFDKLARADAFVFLDEVVYPRRSWVNRSKINIMGEARWLTCPIDHLEYGMPINSARIDDSRGWRSRARTTLEHSYGRARNFQAGMDLLGALLDAPESNLSSFNISAIRQICGSLGIEAETHLQSELAHEGAANELLISLTKAAGGDAYLVGGGAGGYHDQSAFDRSGVAVIEQNYVPHPYGAESEFIPGLSIIDYLMHDGRPLGGNGGLGS